MCQAIRDGGRRCAVHRHSSIGIVKAVTNLTENLNRHQVERLFSELRREGASSDIPVEVFNAVRTNYLATVELNDETREAVEAQFTLSAEHDQDIDSASMYAFTTLTSRARQRDTALNSFFTETAERTGLSVEEVKARFKREYDAVDTSRGSATPAEYDQNTRRRAVLANLPYDRASVTAIEKLKAWNPATETAEATETVENPEAEFVRRRIELTERSGVIGMVGYHNGRLEIQFRNRNGLSRIYGYQNIPENIAEEMINGDSPIHTYNSQIRGVEEYQYANQAADEADAMAYRCVNCGQFRSLSSHECPSSEARPEILAEVGDTEAANTALAESWPETATLADNELNEQTEDAVETAAEEAAIEAETPAEPEATEEATPAPRTRRRRTPAARPTRLRGVPTELAFPDVEAFEMPEYPTGNAEGFTYDHPAFVQPVDFESIEGSQLIQDRIYREDMSAYSGNIPMPDNAYKMYRGLDGLEGSSVEAEALPFFRAATEEGLTPVALTVHDSDSGETLNKLFVEEQYAVVGHAARVGESYIIPIRKRVLVESVPRRIHGEEESEERIQQREAARLVREAESAAFEAAWGTESDENVAHVSHNGRNLPSARNINRIRQQFEWIRFPNKRDFNTPLRAGKVVVAQVAALPTYHSTQFIAEDGTLVTTPNRRNSWGNSVYGKVAFRQRPDGVVEIVGRDLKCRCVTYQQLYRCIHIETATEAYKSVAQMTTPYRPEIEGISSSLTSSGAARFGRIVPSVGNLPASFRFNEHDGYRNMFQALSATMTIEEAATRRQRILDFAAENENRLPREMREEYIELCSSNPEPFNGYASVEVSRARSNAIEHVGTSNITIPVRNVYRAEGEEYGQTQVLGEVMIGVDSTIDNLNIVHNSLRCTCPAYRENYDCEHIRDTVERRLRQALEATDENSGSDIIRNSVTDYEGHQRMYSVSSRIINDLGWSNQPYEAAEMREIDRERYEREERERVAREAAERARMYNEYRESRTAAWQNTGASLAENMETFQEEISELTRRRERGERIIEMQYENVTDGICAPGENTRSFGVEIEFDVASGRNRSEVLRNIGRELYAEGLTNTDRQSRYHASHGSWERWSFEEDCTVAGEIVSPIMKDTPEHWQELEKVIEIVKRNGGIASTRAGSHVHVSSGSYAQGRAQHAELTRLVRQDEDTVFRLASDPGRGTHRGARWCSPDISLARTNIEPGETGYGAGVASGHGSMLNYQGSVHERNLSRAHVEFRMWDSTLDAAVIQQQVALSAAYVDLAEREVSASEGTYLADNGRTARPLGHAVSQNRPPIREMNAEQFEESQRPVAEMFDRLFRTDEQRQQIMRLYAMTNDQRNN